MSLACSGYVWRERRITGCEIRFRSLRFIRFFHWLGFWVRVRSDVEIVLTWVTRVSSGLLWCWRAIHIMLRVSAMQTRRTRSCEPQAQAYTLSGSIMWRHLKHLIFSCHDFGFLTSLVSVMTSFPVVTSSPITASKSRWWVKDAASSPWWPFLGFCFTVLPDEAPMVFG